MPVLISGLCFGRRGGDVAMISWRNSKWLRGAASPRTSDEWTSRFARNTWLAFATRAVFIRMVIGCWRRVALLQVVRGSSCPHVAAGTAGDFPGPIVVTLGQSSAR
jgi:hypothetical protein